MISIIICTYNRATLLRRVLEDIALVTQPNGHDVEIVVVDNNSTDGTPELLRGWKRCGPYPIRCVHERQKGLSHARNRGIKEARGKWIVFTDDDVGIEANWLAELIHGLEDYNAQAGGGRVQPIWPARLPAWVTTEGPLMQKGVFLHYDLGERSRLLDLEDPMPFGCNMAFRADLFDRYGTFRPELGRVGRRLMAGEDTEMFERLRTEGVPTLYLSRAVVHHPVESKRLTLTYLMQWKYWAGYGEGRTSFSERERSVCGVPLYLFKNLTANMSRFFVYGMRRNQPAMAFHLGKICAEAGFVHGAWFGDRKPSVETIAGPALTASEH